MKKKDERKVKARVIRMSGKELTVSEGIFLANKTEFFESCKGFEETVVLPNFEPLTFNTGNTKYTCDFLGMLPNNELVVIEIKASTKQKGYYYSRARMAAVAGVFPMFHYITVFPDPSLEPHEWKFKVFK
jgi:hypothetical protein